MRREVPIVITVVVGVFMVLKFFTESGTTVAKIADEIEQWAILAAACAYVLGVANLTRINGKKIIRKDPEWFYAGTLLFGMFATLTIGIVEFVKFGDSGEWSKWIFSNIFRPLQMTMFSLLAFFIASAAFRAFRARSLEATLLLVSGVILLLGRVPFGDLLPLVSASDVQQWLMLYPSSGALRAVGIGAGLGLVATGLRIIVGIDRPYLR